ncbi:hypothetical protein [Pedobacter faecalis]|uniref:hypothetical protein n=1 Tax=Pedobacter faecalis TaxID=3041495 RepID=UPI00254D70CF|nr:hypothetical protein [Pedobacter sp. ELA7]
MLIGAVYQLYQPLSFLSAFEIQGHDRKAVGKLPPGVRDQVALCLNLHHPEEVNRLKSFIEPWMRPINVGVERPFRSRVMQIVDQFKKYSINSWETQMELFA